MFKKPSILFIVLIIVGVLILTGISCRKEKVEVPVEVPIEAPKEETKKPDEVVPKEEAEKVEEEEWLTYNNTRFNFSIIYPEDWSKEESFNKDGAVFKLPSTKQPSPAIPAYLEAEFRAYGSHLVLSGSNEKGFKTLEEYVFWIKENEVEEWEGFPYQFTDEKSYTVGGKKGIRLAGEFSKNVDDFKFVEFIYVSLDKVWVVRCEAVKGKFDDYAKIFDQIIDSLKIEEEEVK